MEIPEPNVITSTHLPEHFVLDIDNKDFFFVFENNAYYHEDILNLFEYIKESVNDIKKILNYDGIKKSQKKERKIILMMK